MADNRVWIVRIAAINGASPPSCRAKTYDAGEAGQVANNITITNVSPVRPVNDIIRAADTGININFKMQVMNKVLYIE